VLAGSGVIEEVPERAHGRERWWCTIPVDLREMQLRMFYLPGEPGT
jgi:hypothetical protein